MHAISEYTVDALSRQCMELDCKPSHAAIMLRRYYQSAGAVDWESIRLPKGLKKWLASEAVPFSTTVARRQVAEDGTTKLLLQLGDGRKVETVLMTDHRQDRVAGCLSSQVGCAMGCDFCATAQGGLERNLTSGEIVEQYLRLRSEAALLGRSLRTVVFMGMGEPMHNLPAVLAAVRRIGGEGLGALGWRQITVSTVGIVPGIDALASEGLRINLALSLHAPDDATRARLLPPGRRYKVEDILSAADRYQAATTQPVIIQYCLLDGVNDSADQAEQLAGLMQGRRMHVNLLHYNSTGPGMSGTLYQPSTRERADHFIGILRARGVISHFRRPRGRDIAAACGQLRAADAASAKHADTQAE